MSKRHNQHIHSPSFKEYSFRALKNATTEDRQRLELDELRFFKDETTIRAFCYEEPMDRVLYILSKVGVEWTLTIEKGVLPSELIKFNADQQYLYPLKRADITEAAARNGVCVVSSRDVITLSHMVAQDCTTKRYAVSDANWTLISKAGQLKKRIDWEISVDKAHEANDLFNDVLLEQLNSMEYAEDTFGVDQDDLRILASLYKKRDQSIRMTDIATLTKSKGRKMYYRKNMSKLYDMGLVLSEQKPGEKMWAASNFFMISTKGIDVIMTYSKYIYKNSFGA